MNQGKNVSGVAQTKIELPDNQQERLKTIGWIIGFVDGEGSFSVSIFQNKKARMKFGWQVFPEFVVAQGEKSLYVLEDIQRLFGCGRIYKSGYKDTDNHKEPLHRYCVRSVEDLSNVILPFFRKKPSRSYKLKEFEKFEQILGMIKRKEHLTEKGLRNIAEIVQTMNHKKASRFLESSETIRRDPKYFG